MTTVQMSFTVAAEPVSQTTVSDYKAAHPTVGGPRGMAARAGEADKQLDNLRAPYGMCSSSVHDIVYC